MVNCQTLYVLSAIACQLVDCLSEEEAEVLSADLSTLSDMISSVLARQALCESCCRHNSRDDEEGAVKKLPKKKIAEVVRLQRFFGIIMLCN